MADQDGKTGEEIVREIYENMPDKPLSERSDQWLVQRYHLGTTLIKLIQDDPDPRVPEAIKRLQDQKETILNEILRRGLPPPNQTVNLKALEWNVDAPAARKE